MKRLLILTAMISMLSSCGSPESDHSAYQSSNPEGMRQICDFVKNCNCYFIATEEGDQARVRPFGTMNIFEGKLYIQTGHSKNVAKQIAENPRVELCAFNGSEWIRVSGKLVDDERVEAKASMLEVHPELQGMYDAADPNTAVFYFTEGIATIDSFVSDRIVIEF